MSVSIWPERTLALQTTARNMGTERWLDDEQVRAVLRVAEAEIRTSSVSSPFDQNGLRRVLGLLPLGADGLNPDALLYLHIANEKRYQEPTLILSMVSYPSRLRPPDDILPEEAAGVLDWLAAHSIMPADAAGILDRLVTQLNEITGLVPHFEESSFRFGPQ